MITNPTPQRDVRAHRANRPSVRLASGPQHHAVLASRLTERDRWLLRMVHEHRVLTATQIAALAFPSLRSSRQRMRELYQFGVVDRFQPFIAPGTAPMHYTLAPAGAAVLAAEDGLEVKDLGYRHTRAAGIAYSLRLAHAVGVAEWFTALVAHARHALHGEAAVLGAWWSETRCARHFGDLVRPDAYGRWSRDGTDIEMFLEYDFGTEALVRLGRKLPGYAALAAATQLTTPVLVWFPTARREAAARREMLRAWRDLDDPYSVPVATAAADLLDPQAPYPSPADEVWLPLHTTGLSSAGEYRGRWQLHRLGEAWPSSTDPRIQAPSQRDPARPAMPAPFPMPPTRARRQRPQQERG